MAKTVAQRSASFFEAGRIALESLGKNKLRSFLTLLGIILATTTLISVTALIHGMNLYIAEKVSNMGSDGFRVARMVWLGQADFKKLLLMSKRNPVIRREEYEFVKDNATMLRAIGIIANNTVRVGFQGQNLEGVNLQGITANVPALNNVQIDAGTGITENQVARHASVAFIGSEIKDKFFSNRDPVGKFDPDQRCAVRSGRGGETARKRVRAITRQLRHDPDRYVLQDVRDASAE